SPCARTLPRRRRASVAHAPPGEAASFRPPSTLLPLPWGPILLQGKFSGGRSAPTVVSAGQESLEGRHPQDGGVDLRGGQASGGHRLLQPVEHRGQRVGGGRQGAVGPG